MLTTVNHLQAYLYRYGGEDMPAPILNSDGEVNVDADNAQLEAWSQGADDYQSPDPVYLERFLLETEDLLDGLLALEIDSSQPVTPQYMTLFYDAAKAVFDHDKTRLREYFRWLYLVVFQREDGPRWGEFVDIYGVEQFNTLVRRRFNTIPGN